jgi:hypothetical protein
MGTSFPKDGKARDLSRSCSKLLSNQTLAERKIRITPEAYQRLQLLIALDPSLKAIYLLYFNSSLERQAYLSATPNAPDVCLIGIFNTWL